MKELVLGPVGIGKSIVALCSLLVNVVESVSGLGTRVANCGDGPLIETILLTENGVLRLLITRLLVLIMTFE